MPSTCAVLVSALTPGPSSPSCLQPFHHPVNISGQEQWQLLKEPHSKHFQSVGQEAKSGLL